MAREQFEGRLIHTQVRPDGPAGRPMTQVIFHTTDDNTPTVAVWHASDPPENLQPGNTYVVTGDYVHHKEHHYFFRPVVEAIEAAVQPKKVRHLLFRPRDWRRAHKVIASVSLGLPILLAGLVVSYASGRSDTRPQPSSQPTSSRQTEQSGAVAATSEPAETATPASSAPSTDCTSRITSYQTITRIDSSKNKGTRTIVTAGVTGTTQVCYPEGRDKPAVETVSRQPVNEVVAIGSKMTSSSNPAAATQPTQTTTQPTQTNPPPAVEEPEPEPEEPPDETPPEE